MRYSGRGSQPPAPAGERNGGAGRGRMATAETRVHRRIRPSDLPDPLYWLWRKLTSVRVAISMITLMVLMALTAVIIPQVPPQLAGEATAVQQHIDDQRGTFGPFTDLLAGFPWFYDTRGGIFNLFSQPYWYALVAVVATAVSVCTVSRFPPIWRFVHRPTVRVGDRYFERARHRLDFATPADSGAIEAVLRRQRFRIRSEERDGARYLFADRYPWAQLATFASHLALLLLLLGTLITKFGAEEFQFWLGEGQSRPLFETAGDRQQIQVIVDDAIARFNDAGQALDFRSLVRVTSGGQEVAAGAVTVNGPLSAAGFRIHQAAYWEHGAALQVRDAGTGQLLYSETLFLDQQFFGPRVRVEDALTGVLRSEEVIALPLEIPDVPGGAYELIPLAPDRSLALALLPAGEGPPQFRYSVLPVGAAAGRSALPITSADLRLGEAPPPAPRVRIFDAGSGELLADDLIPLEDAGSEAAPGLRIGHLPLNDATTLTVGLDESGGVQRFFYFDLQDESRRGLLAPGERVTLDALTLEFVEAAPDGSHFGTLAPGERQRIGGRRPHVRRRGGGLLPCRGGHPRRRRRGAPALGALRPGADGRGVRRAQGRGRATQRNRRHRRRRRRRRWWPARPPRHRARRRAAPRRPGGGRGDHAGRLRVPLPRAA